MSSITKLGHLHVKTLTVDGEVYQPPAEPAKVADSTPVPVAPYPLPLPEKLTMAALKQRQDHLLAALVEAGIIAPEGERPAAPQSAPETVEVQTPVVKDESGTQGTPQAITAGVVDGA